jgi:hypothetical protein
MFDLETAISEWRRRMLASGIKAPVPLDELESHLRDGIDRQLSNAVDPEEAFRVAIQQIGSANCIKEEFNKTGAMKSTRKHAEKIIGAIGFGVYAVTAGYGLFVNRIGASWKERLLGLSAVVITGLVIVASAYSWRVVPVIPGKKLRMTIGLGCALFGVFITWLVFNVAMPRFDLNLAQMEVATLWGLVPLLIGGSIYSALSEAAERNAQSVS